jgi:AP-2 complex subunit beta-1
MTDTNPLIRALALRTVSYIHVKEFVERTIQPLKQLMSDNDPYVRKTSAFCVAKLYDHDKSLVERSDLIDRLNRMLKDENPTVVASALAALMDIWERSESIKLTIDYPSASKIVSILPDCSEYAVIVAPSNLSVLLMMDQMGSDLHIGVFDGICASRVK